MTIDVSAIILAAGHGTRMKSSLSKVLHPVAGRPLVHHPMTAAWGVNCQELVLVVGPHNQAELTALAGMYPRAVTLAVQTVARGTGDAARVGLAGMKTQPEWVLILCGDTPLVEAGDLQAMVTAAAARPQVDLWIMTCELEDPTGYGRILRDTSGVLGIREQRDLKGPAEEGIKEINSGIYLVRRATLAAALRELKPNNAQGEYYLTDIVPVAAAAGGARSVLTGLLASLGVNDRAQLFDLEQKWFGRRNDVLRRSGVTVGSGVEVDVDSDAQGDASLGKGAKLCGRTRVRARAQIGVGCLLTNVEVGEGAVLGAYSVLEDVQIEAGAVIPPHTVKRG